jgi:glucosamine--fructose-6-phosphate aminotransferase (isomerizing)
VFKSQTDTEVLAHLVHDIMMTTGASLVNAVPQALAAVQGAYGVVFTHADEPDVIVGAKMGSPLLIAIGNDGMFMGSDATAFMGHTNKVIYLKVWSCVR